jgi:hypothetical protein
LSDVKFRGRTNVLSHSPFARRDLGTCGKGLLLKVAISASDGASTMVT